MTGTLCFVLHSHIPYVLGHGRWPHGVDWLHEAVAETYLPLLRVCDELLADGITPHLTFSVTPVLAEQLTDPRYPEEFASYLAVKRDAAAADEANFRRTGYPRRAVMAGIWARFYAQATSDFRERYGDDVVSGFRQLQNRGAIEIMTSAATHGYLPLLGNQASAEAQIRQGVKAYARHFGRAPRGIWLPECAYRPRGPWTSPVDPSHTESSRAGVEEMLAESGIRYFVADSHLLTGGTPLGLYRGFLESPAPQFTDMHDFPLRDASVHAAYDVGTAGARADRSPVAVVARDPATALQVWSADAGYPGDGAYLEFHKKHHPGGLRYWSVTSRAVDLGEKEPYDPALAAERVREHAAHFVRLVKDTLARDHAATGTPGLLLAPFDSELFGHWWFEGPRFLQQVLRLLHNDPDVRVSTVSDYLEAQGTAGTLQLIEGSWGAGGHHGVWLNDATEWTWRHIHAAEATLAELAREALQTGDPLLERVVRQAARELMLLEASDWQFLISTWSARDYAEMRVAEHLEAFERLAAIARERLGSAGGEEIHTPGDHPSFARQRLLHEDDRVALEALEFQDRLFPDLDLTWWAPMPARVSPPRLTAPNVPVR